MDQAMPTARYRSIKQFILKQLASGALKSGARVPSEYDLVQKFDVSRMTANRALRELADEGLLVRIAGVGSFVAEQRVHSHPLEIRNIAHEIHTRGHEHRTRVVLLESVSAPYDIAGRCGVSTGAKLDHSVLVHFEGDAPLQVEDRYVNPLVVAGYLKNDFSKITPHEFLMQVAPLQRAEHTVRAVAPDARIRRLLKLSKTEPCLLIRRRTWAHDRIATIADLFHPGARYELTGAFRQDSAGNRPFP